MHRVNGRYRDQLQVLKRFMTWLLHKLQRVLGSLTGRKRGSQVSESTQLGSEIASRLQSSKAAFSDDPVAVRVQGISLEPPSLAQSTAPLRQKNSSVLKDTVDPVAAEPDTHQRLDAAPASLPGGTLAAPSFPTNVSDLLSPQPSQSSDLNGDVLDSITVSSVEPPANDEQLPDIHDLLPAVEPDSPSDESYKKEARLVDSSSDAETVTTFDSPLVESAQRVSVSEQATLFSFDIIETDTAVEGDVIERDSVDSESADGKSEIDHDLEDRELAGSELIEGEPSEGEIVDQVPVNSELPDDEFIEDPAVSTAVDINAAADASNSPPMSQSSAIELPIVGSLIPDSLLSDLSARTSGDQAATETADVEESINTKTVEAEDPLVAGEAVETSSSEVQNPWLTAVPPQQKASVEAVPQELLIKNGTVKLLFKLKAGNFHGYITPDDGGKDILFHQKYINAEIFEHIERGTSVVVTAKYREGKAYATRVELL